MRRETSACQTVHPWPFVFRHEGFYDALTVKGAVTHDFVSHYYLSVLETMRTRWISPQIMATDRINATGYREVREMGQPVISASGNSTSATHMEWF